jgi:hypothetical protein
MPAVESNIMKTEITVVDRGRGPQLSTCRVTVQDLVPYFQDGCAHAEIMRWIPVLSEDEIRVVEQYVKDHYEQVMAEDRRIRERNVNRKNPPAIEKILEAGGAKLESLREQLQRSKGNGEAQ